MSDDTPILKQRKFRIALGKHEQKCKLRRLEQFGQHHAQQHDVNRPYCVAL